MNSMPMAVAQSEAFENSDPLQRLLRLAGVGADQAIAVAGANTLDMMVALCRCGHQRVECARQATRSGASRTSAA